MKGKKRSAPTQDRSLGNLIDSLVKKTAEISSKEERIQKRLAKKRRREERQEVKGQHEQLLDRKQAPKKVSRDDKDKKSESQYKSSKRKLQELAFLVQRIVEERSSSRRPFQPVHAKSVKHRKLNWNENDIQPRKRDYGGIGLARPSLFLTNSDPAFLPRLEEEFLEHIPGFFGKQRTKAVKKQNKMLWQQMKDIKKVNGVNLGKMTPDERVEYMLQAGMI